MNQIVLGRPKEEDTLKIHAFLDKVIIDTYNKNGIGHLRDIIQEEKTYKRSCLRQDFDSAGKDRYFIIAKIGDYIVGTIEFGPSNEIIRNHDDTLRKVKEVGTVFVHPDYQGQGIGKMLLDAIGRSLLDNGYEECVLDSGYPSAQKIWGKKFGAPYHLLENYWGQDSHHMIWKISPNQLIDETSRSDARKENELIMTVLDNRYAVCRLEAGDKVPDWAYTSDWCSVTKTFDEVSIVVEEGVVPTGVMVERNWRIMKVVGPLDFDMVGILARLSKTLADAGVSIFAVSTYDTDYVFVKESMLTTAVKVLGENGIRIE